MSRYVCYSVCFSIFEKNSKVNQYSLMIVVDRCGIVVDRRGIVVDRCGSLWVVADRCGSLWVVVGRCGSLWVVPGFSNYDRGNTFVVKLPLLVDL